MQVSLKERENRLCKVEGDPHIETLDGLRYHNYDVGQFILLATKSERNFTVGILILILKNYFSM